MPIYLDRHDIKGVKATDVAALHLKDLEIQDRYGVKYLTYWFDEERGTTFCLVDAPDETFAERVHREAHGGVAVTAGFFTVALGESAPLTATVFDGAELYLDVAVGNDKLFLPELTGFIVRLNKIEHGFFNG